RRALQEGARGRREDPQAAPRGLPRLEQEAEEVEHLAPATGRHGSWERASAATHFAGDGSQVRLPHSPPPAPGGPALFASWQLEPSQYATPSLQSPAPLHGPLTGLSAHLPLTQSSPSAQPLICAAPSQLAPISPIGAQVPAVAPVLAKLNPLQTSPVTQASTIASALLAVHGLPVAIWLRQRPPSAARSHHRPPAHIRSLSHTARPTAP